LWKGKWSAHTTRLWNQLLATDIPAEFPALEIPVYFFHGIFDYTVCYPLSKDYFEKLQAPLKGFYTFENSAHSPLFEEPEKVLKILREDVLAGTINLAGVRP
jgi:pimeloyl-ACP methyl ester carboxylesterase